MREGGIQIHSLLSISRSTTPRTLIFKGAISEHYKLLLIMGKASLELYRVFEMSLSLANMANSWGPGSRNTQYYISQRAESTLTYLPPMSSSSLFATFRLSPPYLKYSLYSSTCSIMTPRWRENICIEIKQHEISYLDVSGALFHTIALRSLLAMTPEKNSCKKEMLYNNLHND